MQGPGFELRPPQKKVKSNTMKIKEWISRLVSKNKTLIISSLYWTGCTSRKVGC